MKYLETFNLEVQPNDIIVVHFPTKEETSSLILSKTARAGERQGFPFARPMVVAKVGSNVGKEDLTMQIAVGDMVFIKNEFAHSSILLGFDEHRTWKNPVIVPAYAVAAKAIYTEDYEKEFEEIVEKVEIAIIEREERLKKIK